MITNSYAKNEWNGCVRSRSLEDTPDLAISKKDETGFSGVARCIQFLRVKFFRIQNSEGDKVINILVFYYQVPILF